ncbi:MAG TPA: acylphosphatase [Candidatus Limnocylindria bacterium]
MRRRFVVRGMVQGVNFRATAAAEARRLGLTGRIWNRDDGAVECVAEGEPAALERLREWLRQGPRMARVERVDASELDGATRYAEFAIARER